MNTKMLPWVPASQRAYVPLQSAYANECNIILTRRIGSPSANGVVYECECTLGTHSAIKFIQPGPDADNEIATATYLSQRVQQGQSTRFPLVYGSAHCPEMQMSDSDHFTRAAKEAHIRRELVAAQQVAKVHRPAQIKRMQKGQAVYTIEELSEGLPDEMIQEILHCPTFAVDALLSEIAYSDVNYLIQQGLSDTVLADIAQQVLEGLMQMLGARVSHGDLHFGNVLVRQINDKMFVLLHDFGTSQLDCLHPGDYLDDIGKVMDAISHTGKLDREVNLVLDLLEESAACSLGEVPLVQQQARDIFRAVD